MKINGKISQKIGKKNEKKNICYHKYSKS